MEKLITAVDHWLTDRPTMREDNHGGTTLLRLFCGEYEEFCEACSGKNKEELRDCEEFKGELADLGLYLISIFHWLELDFVKVCMDKLSYNMLRYPAKDYQSGNFQDAMKWNRERTKRLKLKEVFYASAA